MDLSVLSSGERLQEAGARERSEPDPSDLARPHWILHSAIPNPRRGRARHRSSEGLLHRREVNFEQNKNEKFQRFCFIVLLNLQRAED